MVFKKGEKRTWDKANTENYTWRCKKCGGRMGAKSTHLSKRWNIVTRLRICTKCGYKVKTAEVDFDDFQRQESLIKALETAISAYLQGNETIPKMDK